jgi:hypothetical protein
LKSFYSSKKYLSLSLNFNSDSVDLFPVASSTRFFTDMHHLLKLLSRSICMLS